MIFHDSRLGFLWFQVGLCGFSRFLVGFYGLIWFTLGFHCSRLVFEVSGWFIWFQVGF